MAMVRSIFVADNRHQRTLPKAGIRFRSSVSDRKGTMRSMTRLAMLDGCPIGIGNNRAGIEAMLAALPQAVAQGLDAAFRKSLVMHSGR